jgi:hypothetical protein
MDNNARNRGAYRQVQRRRHVAGMCAAALTLSVGGAAVWVPAATATVVVGNEKMTFYSYRDSIPPTFVINPVDSSPPSDTRSTSWYDTEPAWPVRPNTELTFLNNRDGDNDIFVMNAFIAGSNQTHNPPPTLP